MHRASLSPTGECRATILVGGEGRKAAVFLWQWQQGGNWRASHLQREELFKRVLYSALSPVFLNRGTGYLLLTLSGVANTCSVIKFIVVNLIIIFV